MALIKPKKPVTETDRRHSPRDCQGLLMQLLDSEATQRRWAARDLAAFPQAAHDLCRHLERETDSSVREAVLTSLINIGDSSAAAGLIPFLNSDDAALRNAAINALQQMPEAVAPHMESLLENPDSDIRILAINILEYLRCPRTPGWLLRVIQEDEHVNVCATAVNLLAEIGTPDMLPALQELADRFAHEPFIGFAVKLAMRRIDGKDELAAPSSDGRSR